MAVTDNFEASILSMVTDIVSAENAIDGINKAIFKQTFGIGELTQSHTLRTGVRDGSLVPIVMDEDNYCAMPVGNQQSCDLNECDLDTEYSAKKWCLPEYNCVTSICMRNVNENFLAFWNMYRQKLENPLEKPDHQAYLAFLTDKTSRNIRGAQWRTAYWGDSLSESTLINGCDGFFAQAEAGSGYKEEISISSATPTGEEILKAIKNALNDNYEATWIERSNVVVKMSYAMANLIVIYLNDLDQKSPYDCTCVSPDGLVRANRFTVQGLHVSGIPVEAHREIDGGAACEGVNGNKFQLIIAQKSNLLVGTNSLDSLSQLRIFYVEKEHKVYIESMINQGVSIPMDEYIYLHTGAAGS